MIDRQNYKGVGLCWTGEEHALDIPLVSIDTLERMKKCSLLLQSNSNTRDAKTDVTLQFVFLQGEAFLTQVESIEQQRRVNSIASNARIITGPGTLLVI